MRHITYQFDWGYSTHDKNTEQEQIDQIEAEGKYIDKFPVTVAEREIIDQPGAGLHVEDGELIVEPPSEDPLMPIIRANNERMLKEQEEYVAWMQSPEGKTAQRYMYFMQNNFYPEEENLVYNLNLREATQEQIDEALVLFRNGELEADVLKTVMGDGE